MAGLYLGDFRVVKHYLLKFPLTAENVSHTCGTQVKHDALDVVSFQYLVGDKMLLSNKLLADVKLFTRDLGIAESALGVEAVGDGSIIARLRAGKSITLRSADKINIYMANMRLKRAERAAREGGA